LLRVATDPVQIEETGSIGVSKYISKLGKGEGVKRLHSKVRKNVQKRGAQ